MTWDSNPNMGKSYLIEYKHGIAILMDKSYSIEYKHGIAIHMGKSYLTEYKHWLTILMGKSYLISDKLCTLMNIPNNGEHITYLIYIKYQIWKARHIDDSFTC
jgi:hypothetical protein